MPQHGWHAAYNNPGATGSPGSERLLPRPC